MIRLAEPWMLLLILPVIVGVWLAARGHLGGRAGLLFSSLQILGGRHRGFRLAVLQALRVIALLLLAVALARPQSGHRDVIRSTEGVDVMLVMVTSSSMQAEDMQPGKRLAAAKLVAIRFVLG